MNTTNAYSRKIQQASESTKGLQLAPPEWVPPRMPSLGLPSSTGKAGEELQEFGKSKKTADAVPIADVTLRKSGAQRQENRRARIGARTSAADTNLSIEEQRDRPEEEVAIATPIFETSTIAVPTVLFETPSQASTSVATISTAANGTATSVALPPVPPAVVPTTVVTTSTATCGTVNSGKAHVPPNAPSGGQWVTRKSIGPATWSTCAIVSCCTCIFCLLPCGLWAFLCPCDKKLVYIYHGTAYDEHGRVVGRA